MKLQKLTIRNLASIEDAVIDFEHGPLGEKNPCSSSAENRSRKNDHSRFDLSGSLQRDATYEPRRKQRLLRRSTNSFRQERRYCHQ